MLDLSVSTGGGTIDLYMQINSKDAAIYLKHSIVAKNRKGAEFILRVLQKLVGIVDSHQILQNFATN